MATPAPFGDPPPRSYVAGDDLDVVHQATLVAFDMDSKWPAGFDTEFEKTLFRLTETNIGHMHR